MRKLTLLLIVVFLLLATACSPQEQSTDPDPIIYEINKTMYCTSFLYHPQLGHRANVSYEIDLCASVSDYAAAEDLIDISFVTPSTTWREAIDFTIIPGENSWPYFCAIGGLYYPEENSYYPYVLALDPKQEYLIFKENGNTGACTVASANPNADPLDILEYFEDFLVAYSYGYYVIPE